MRIRRGPKTLSLWDGVCSDYAALIFQNADPPDFRAVEFQANADATTILGNENGAGVFERGLQRLADIQAGKADAAFEFLDDRRIHACIAGELFTGPFDQRPSGTALRTSDHHKSPSIPLSGAKSPPVESQDRRGAVAAPSKMHIESEKGRAASLIGIEIMMQNNYVKAAINFVCLVCKDKGSSGAAKLTGSSACSRSQRQEWESWRYRAKGTLGSAMMMDTLVHDIGSIVSGPDMQRRVVGRMVSANHIPIARADDNALKTRLREELVLQAQTRLPITYGRLAKSMVISGATGVIRDALEQLMDDDANEDQPLLAAVAVKALEPGARSLVLPESRGHGAVRWRSGRSGSLCFPRKGILSHDPSPCWSVTRRAGLWNYLASSSAACRQVKENEMLIAKDIMTSPVISVGPDSTVDEVADILLSHGISGVPVIDRGELLGIVSEGDLIRRAEIGTALRGRSWWLRFFSNNAAQAEGYVRSHSAHVTDVMTRQVATATESTSIVEIAALLESNRIKRVPVLRGGQVVGIVSRANLVRALLVARKRSRIPAWHDDDSIRRKILDALRSESWPLTGSPDVTVANGVVTFWGTYLSEQERKASLILAENTAGVRAIDDHRIPLDMTYGVV
ncbi:CBS domain-containing protein [Mesorhizobium sp. PAMC28654]|uniref:CBS domain-containing protein n=1 Tax=Mesorhizobium sp. PAMC28654 TaxID=2880934 RepID=UPI001D09D284|nr:CBS domain-containing protein [Mesorhizobium sp. PAMC28654]UDL90445.1 CBS domain-containing protein [Mesorhizobium sp. PAMC28654]